MTDETCVVHITRYVFLAINANEEIIDEYKEYHPSPYVSMDQLSHFIEWLKGRKIEYVIIIDRKPLHMQWFGRLIVLIMKKYKFIPNETEVYITNK